MKVVMKSSLNLCMPAVVITNKLMSILDTIHVAYWIRVCLYLRLS